MRAPGVVVADEPLERKHPLGGGIEHLPEEALEDLAARRETAQRFAAEWGSYNINVNCISPSHTLSPARRKDPQENRDLIRSLHPMGWHQRPDDLAGTLIYFASDASNYVTGQEVLVDGGHTLNVWLAPLDRAFPPLVSAEEETRVLIRDLDILGIPHDDNGVTFE